MRSATTSVAPAVSVAELVVTARANPGKIHYASPGSGLPAHVGTWFAMLVPKGTPREVRVKLHADVATLLKEPAVTELMLKQGMTPAGGTPEELHDLIRSDFERWNRIVREANIKAD